MPRSEAIAGNEKVYAAEAAIAGLRVAVILLNSFVYAFFLDHSGTIEWLATAIIVSANTYGIGVWALRPYRRYPVMLSSYFTTALDTAFITLWLLATGGFESPFYLLWMLSVTAVAFRYDTRATFVAAGVYAASYLGLLAVLGEIMPNLAHVGLRLGYLFLTAALGGFLSREVFLQTRAKVELQEITAALRDSEERFRRLSDASFEGIAIHEDGRILEANASFARMWGYSPREVIGKDATQLIDPVSLPEVERHLRERSDETYSILARRKDGTTFEVEVSGRDLPWDGRIVRVVAVHDVTERARAERALRERATFAAQNERLREMDVVKSRFINSAAHELGTPLTPIKLQAHLLRIGGLGELNEKQRRAVDVLTRNVDHLGLMVRDLLDASRVQSHELQLKPIEMDIGPVVAEAVESFGAPPGVELSYRGEPGLFARADGARLKQVVFNLVGNALKFTPTGGRVVVNAARETDGIHVSVADSGAGIPPADLPRLFQPFSQVHDTSTQTRAGAGLGLFITKGIIESHGGRVWATSEGPDKGTTIHVMLPPLARRINAQ